MFHDRARFGRRAVTIALLALTALAVGGSATDAQTPAALTCRGAQQFIGNQPPNSVQLLFNCNQTLQSFKVTLSKPLGTTPTAASVEQNGNSQPPPQGFLCTPNQSQQQGYTCSGSATTGNTVRVTENTQENPCAGLKQTVTVGTGMPDVMGNPTGTIRTFDAGPLRGCAAPKPAKKKRRARRCRHRRHHHHHHHHHHCRRHH